MNNNYITGGEHTKTMPDGSKIDINKLIELTQHLPAQEMSLTDIKRPGRDKRTGFSMKRYERTDINHPLLIDENRNMLDGRHRYHKLMDQGQQSTQVKMILKEYIMKSRTKTTPLRSMDGKSDPTGKPNPGLLPIRMGFAKIEDDMKKAQNPYEKYKLAEMAPEFVAIVKKALHTERKQVTQTEQISRQPSAIIIQGNQDYIRGNHAAKKFYNDIADYIRQKGYTVGQVKGEESGAPPGANIWISHGGVNPPEGTKVLNIPQYPRPFITKHLIKALDRITRKR